MNVLESWAEPRPVKLTATDFLQLAQTGALDDYPKTELIDGVIVAMSPTLSTHAYVQGEVFGRLRDVTKIVLPDCRAMVDVSVAISSANMPQADILLTTYGGPRAPIPAETIRLLVEVADSTAAHDRGKKAGMYAVGGIPEYWVIDIQASEAVRFWSPGPDGYTQQDVVVLGKPVSAVTLAGLTVGTDDLLA